MNIPIKNIGVLAPSSWVLDIDIKNAQKFLEDRGYCVHVHPQTFERDNQSAGTHKQKLDAFTDLMNAPNIDIIWAAGGGNRCLHWIDDIDYSALQTPKPVIGFSDVTALINALYAYKGVQTIHGPTFNRAPSNPQIDTLLDLLNGKARSISMDNSNIINNGTAEGHLVGGNLSVFQYLPQTLPNEFYKGGILFLEDCNEELSRIDRMLVHLKRLGVFDQINGVIFGQFGDLPETGTPFGFSLEDIIKEHTDGLDIPIITNAPFGHGKDLYSFPIGRHARLDTKQPVLILSNE